jgi:hypothetical protein
VMAATYEPIASQTLGSAAASVSFTGIGSGYTDLVLVGQARASTPGTFNFNSYVFVQLNSDTGNNYSTTTLFSRSTAGSWSALSTRESNASRITAGPVPDSQHGADILGNIRLQVMSYASTSVFKTVLAESGYSTNLTNHDGPRREVGLYRSTSAITSVSLSLSAGNLVAGSTFSLYGIKAA